MEPMIDDQSQAISEEVSHSGTKSMMTSASAFSCSAYSPAEFASAPLQQTLPGSGFFRRMPCKARGVEGEHVAKNAFIDIPLNAKHGTILSCSHPACRLSGRLFRFCAVCQVPVAKRNFARRHTHGLSIAQIISSSDINNDEPATREPYGTTMRHLTPVAPAALKTRKVSVANGKRIPLAVVSSSSAPMGPPLVKVPGEINFGQQQNGRAAVNNIIINTSYSSVNANINGEAVQNKHISAGKRALDSRSRMNVQVTEDELDWLYLFRQKPGPHESKEAWVKRVEQVAGFSLRPKKMAKYEDEELSEIDAADAEDLTNFDGSNLEDLFE